MVQIRVNYISDSIFNYISSLDSCTSTSCFKAISHLKSFGNELAMPLSKNIGHGLFELRVKEKVNIRIIYTFHQSSAWILHAFKKTGKKISKRDLDIALKRQKLLLA